MLTKGFNEYQLRMVHLCSEIAIMKQSGFVADSQHKELIVIGLIDKILMLQEHLDSDFIKRCDGVPCRLYLISLISSKTC
jgi:hypothetical protein